MPFWPIDLAWGWLCVAETKSVCEEALTHCFHPCLLHWIAFCPNSHFRYNWGCTNTQRPNSNSYFMIVYGPWPLLLLFMVLYCKNIQSKHYFSSMQMVMRWHHLSCDQWVHIHTCWLGHLVGLWKQSLLNMTFLISHIGEPVFAHLRNIPTPSELPLRGLTHTKQEEVTSVLTVNARSGCTIGPPYNELALTWPSAMLTDLQDIYEVIYEHSSQHSCYEAYTR